MAPEIPPGWNSVRELDERLGLPKGSAFKAFRRIAGEWREGEDFRVLDSDADRELIEALRQAGRIYGSSVRPVILGPAFSQALLVTLAGRKS